MGDLGPAVPDAASRLAHFYDVLLAVASMLGVPVGIVIAFVLIVWVPKWVRGETGGRKGRR